MANDNSLQEKTVHLETLLENIEKNRDDILWSIRGLTPIDENVSLSAEFNSIYSLKPETIDLLNRAADIFISVELMNLLENNSLKKYAFFFVAHHFFKVEDVMEDVSNGGVLKKNLPTGSFNKLKKEIVHPQVGPLQDYLKSLPNVGPPSKNQIIETPIQPQVKK